MTLIAKYIGIDKYLDGKIRDLTGATRDATALYSLFSDSIKEIDAELITDHTATCSKVDAALRESLGSAGPDDTVIFFFAGHGTHDHHLVCSDTDITQLSTTTIPFHNLSKYFKESKAKAVLCILDCCFSGEAPARVLEDSPIPRDPSINYDAFAGEGRLLLAASNFDEPAYETPGSGHGLLTKALIDIFQSEQDFISLPTAMDKVLAVVRAEAAKMGVSQTPVFFGNITGGLTLPTLKAGEKYFTAFPEKRGIRITKDFQDLSKLGIQKTVIEEWSKKYEFGINELQLEAINEYRILDGKSLLVVSPTSSGKTFIGELAAVKAITDGKRALFLLPYKALVNEKYDQFLDTYQAKLGIRVIRCTGDYQDRTESFVRGKYDLALLTYEMFLNIVVSNPSILNQVGLVVLDEGQFITDPNRGITVELLLTFLLSAREKGVNPQLIVLSAVIGNVNSFDEWLGSRKLVSYKRPIPLTEGVFDRSGEFQYIDFDGEDHIKQLLPSGSIYVRREKPSSQDMIVPLVKKLVSLGEKVIVFRNQKGAAQGCAAYLAKELGLPPAEKAIRELPTRDLPTTSSLLRSCLEGGTAFHNTNLTREERAIVERDFRDPNSKIRVLVATTTVAAGINTPASTVILAEKEFLGDDGRPFTVAEYKNMAGRAGRLGFKEEGKAVILADNSFEREMFFTRYVKGKLESLQSSFDPKNLDTWLIRLLAQVRRIEKNRVQSILANTFGGFVAAKSDPDWINRNAAHLDALLHKMITLGLVEEEGDFIQLTLLGQACGKSSLSFQSAMRLVEFLKRPELSSSLNAHNLIPLIQVLPESDGGYTPMFKRGKAEFIRPQQMAERYGASLVQLLQRYASDNFEYLARCKRASILWDWINGRSVGEIEKEFTVNPYSGIIGHGEIRKFADATRFHLRSASEIVWLLFPGTIDEKSIDNLLRQLEVGIPSDGLGLLELPLNLSRGEYLSLYGNGMRTKEQVCNVPDEKLISILGKSQVENLRLSLDRNI
jgi:helicase